MKLKNPFCVKKKLSKSGMKEIQERMSREKERNYHIVLDTLHQPDQMKLHKNKPVWELQGSSKVKYRSSGGSTSQILIGDMSPLVVPFSPISKSTQMAIKCKLGSSNRLLLHPREKKLVDDSCREGKEEPFNHQSSIGLAKNINLCDESSPISSFNNSFRFQPVDEQRSAAHSKSRDKPNSKPPSLMFGGASPNNASAHLKGIMKYAGCLDKHDR